MPKIQRAGKLQRFPTAPGQHLAFQEGPQANPVRRLNEGGNGWLGKRCIEEAGDKGARPGRAGWNFERAADAVIAVANRESRLDGVLAARVITLFVDSPGEIHRWARRNARIRVGFSVPRPRPHLFDEANLFVHQLEEPRRSAGEVDHTRGNAIRLWPDRKDRRAVRTRAQQIIAAGKSGDRPELVANDEDIAPLQ